MTYDPIPCTWCGEPATCEVETQPAQLRDVKGVKTLVRRAIKAPACEQHRTITQTQDPPPSLKRGARRHPGPDQLTIG